MLGFLLELPAHMFIVVLWLLGELTVLTWQLGSEKNYLEIFYDSVTQYIIKIKIQYNSDSQNSFTKI